MSPSAFVGRNCLYLTISSQVAPAVFPCAGVGEEAFLFSSERTFFLREAGPGFGETGEQIQMHSWSGCMWRRWEKKVDASMSMSGISALTVRSQEGASLFWVGLLCSVRCADWHKPICKVLCDGIMRVGEGSGAEADGRACERVVQPAGGSERVGQSFQTQNFAAQVCRFHHLGKWKFTWQSQIVCFSPFLSEKIPWTEEPTGYCPGVAKNRMRRAHNVFVLSS